MEEMGLGPNGGLIYCFEYVSTEQTLSTLGIFSTRPTHQNP